MAIVSHLGVDPYKAGVLDPKTHSRLVADIDNVARRSGLGERYKSLIWEKPDPHLLEQMEVSWMKQVLIYAQTGMWGHEKLGIAYPDKVPHVADRMRAMTARLIRNMVDARVLSLSEILSERKANDGIVEGTCIFCPDFMIPEYLTTLSDWDRKEMIGWIKDRAKSGKPTSLYVGVDLNQMKANNKFPSVAAEIIASFKTV